MAVNPMQIMKLADRWRIFSSQHPRFVDFVRDIGRSSMQEGTILELKVTEPDGRVKVTNIRLTQEDLESIGIIKDLIYNKQ